MLWVILMGLFLAPEIEKQQDKSPKTFPGIGMENPITFLLFRLLLWSFEKWMCQI